MNTFEYGKEHERIHYIYKENRFCRIDLDCWDEKYPEFSKPFSHPSIKFGLFIETIIDRNRLQSILKEVLKNGTFEMAKRIYSGQLFSFEEIVNDINKKIRLLEIQIECFHKTYFI